MGREKLSKTLYKVELETDPECTGGPPEYAITNGTAPSAFDNEKLRPRIPHADGFAGYGDVITKVADITDAEAEILMRLVPDVVEDQTKQGQAASERAAKS